MYINFKILILFIILLILVLFLTFYLKKLYKEFLNKRNEKDSISFINFYQLQLDLLFKNNDTSYKNWVWICWIHFIIIHILTPLFLSSFLLKTDWNVLIAIISIIVSMNIFQKLYPAELYTDKF